MTWGTSIGGAKEGGFYAKVAPSTAVLDDVTSSLATQVPVTLLSSAFIPSFIPDLGLEKVVDKQKKAFSHDAIGQLLP